MNMQVWVDISTEMNLQSYQVRKYWTVFGNSSSARRASAGQDLRWAMKPKQLAYNPTWIKTQVTLTTVVNWRGSSKIAEQCNIAGIQEAAVHLFNDAWCIGAYWLNNAE